MHACKILLGNKSVSDSDSDSETAWNQKCEFLCLTNAVNNMLIR